MAELDLRVEVSPGGGRSIPRGFGTGRLGVGASSRVLPRGVTIQKLLWKVLTNLSEEPTTVFHKIVPL